jgi:hypothetical protein
VTLSLSRETFNAPDDGLLFGFVLGSTKQSLDLGLSGIFGNWDFDYDVGGEQLVRKVGNYFEIDGNSAREKRVRKTMSTLVTSHREGTRHDEFLTSYARVLLELLE